MARFLAVCEQPGITEQEFRGSFDRMHKWRFGRRAWVIKVYCDLEAGKLTAECEAPDKGVFEEWIMNTGWKISEIQNITRIFEAGTVWPV